MTTEEATIIAAGIAALTSILSSILAGYSIRITKKGIEKNIESNKEISNEVQNAESIRTEAQIDANITWNARVEWIQNVRRVTAEFITACYKYIHSNDCDIDEQNGNLELIQEKKSLLILYFGPDGIEENKKKAQNISDKITNNAKNEMIVDLINKIFEQSRVYFSNEKECKRCHTELIKCIACENAENGKLISCVKDEFEGEAEYFTDNDCKTLQKNLEEDEEKYIKLRRDLFNNIDLLTEAMRIYLKIEWDCTKKRGK